MSISVMINTVNPNHPQLLSTIHVINECTLENSEYRTPSLALCYCQLQRRGGALYYGCDDGVDDKSSHIISILFCGSFLMKWARSSDHSASNWPNLGQFTYALSLF